MSSGRMAHVFVINLELLAEKRKLKVRASFQNVEKVVNEACRKFSGSGMKDMLNFF